MYGCGRLRELQEKKKGGARLKMMSRGKYVCIDEINYIEIYKSIIDDGMVNCDGSLVVIDT